MLTWFEPERNIYLMTAQRCNKFIQTKIQTETKKG